VETFSGGHNKIKRVKSGSTGRSAGVRKDNLLTREGGGRRDMVFGHKQHSAKEGGEETLMKTFAAEAAQRDQQKKRTNGKLEIGGKLGCTLLKHMTRS